MSTVSFDRTFGIGGWRINVVRPVVPQRFGIRRPQGLRGGLTLVSARWLLAYIYRVVR